MASSLSQLLAKVGKAAATVKKKAAPAPKPTSKPVAVYRTPTQTNTTPTRTGGGGGGGGSSSSSKSSSGSSGGYNAAAERAWQIKMRNQERAYQEKLRKKEQLKQDKKDAKAARGTVKALHLQLGALVKSRKQATKNIAKREAEGHAFIEDAFGKLNVQFQKALDDNRKAEHDDTYAARANRARERGDILMEAAAMGAGETDNLRAQSMAVRNWAANQSEVNRAFHDTQQSVNQEVENLNQNTKQNLFNLYGQSNVERSKMWDDYYSGRADVWTQIFNAQNAQSANKQYKVQYKNAAKNAATNIGKKWVDPGIPNKIKNWQGQEVTEESLNNSLFGLQDYAGGMEQKRPEGGTLRKW